MPARPPARPRFTKQGPKRLRRTRRETPEGGYSQWGSCTTHFKRERIAKLAPTITEVWS